MDALNIHFKKLLLITLLSSSFSLTACSTSSGDVADFQSIQYPESTDSDDAAFSDAQLEQMLAPIALYPDSLLTHILIAATYPLEVVMASQLRARDKELSSPQIMDKAEGMDWDPSVTALLAFPAVLEKLSSNLDWTQNLGDAFLDNEARVLARIQSLRVQAYNANSLSEMENMSITHENNQIVVESIQREIVYVPYYDPRVVYGDWRWHRYPPVYWAPAYGYRAHPHSYFSWNRGIRIHSNFFFSAFHWSNHSVVVIDHHNSHRYRHRNNITSGRDSKSWDHKPNHRRGVAYKNSHVKKRYKSHKPIREINKARKKELRRSGLNTVTKHKVSGEKHYTDQAKRLEKLHKPRKHKSEETFAKRLRNNSAPTNSQQPIGVKKRTPDNLGRKVDNYPKKQRIQRNMTGNKVKVISKKMRQIEKNHSLANRPKAISGYKAPQKSKNSGEVAIKQDAKSRPVVQKTKSYPLNKTNRNSRGSLPKNLSLSRTEKRG
ncbi:Uncharacterised protein [marine metagenome]